MNMHLLPAIDDNGFGLGERCVCVGGGGGGGSIQTNSHIPCTLFTCTLVQYTKWSTTYIMD